LFIAEIESSRNISPGASGTGHKSFEATSVQAGLADQLQQKDAQGRSQVMYQSRMFFLHVFRALRGLSVFLLVGCAVFSLAVIGLRAQVAQPVAPAASPSATPKGKPSFSLSTNRTYGTTENARVWISYQNISDLDFRVYQVEDPVKFFRQLNDPHQMGEEEKREVSVTYEEKGPSLLERITSFKRSFFGSIKRYVRNQLRHESRVTFNQKVRGQGGEGDRLPLNFSDYASVPILNSQKRVARFKQPLTPLENEWDQRMVSLGKREPGVYLIEAVNGDLRAYTIAVVTDLTMVNKTAPSGEMLVYAVDRRTGEPRNDVRIEIAKGKKILVTGNTDKDGILRTKITRQQEMPNPVPPEDRDPQEANSDIGKDNYLIMARSKEQFAISDLEPYYFGRYEEESNKEEIVSYLYTDRPVYRPAQKVYFKGILRRVGENGYQAVSARTVNVTIKDPNDGTVTQKVIPLSPRGTFSGEADIAAGAPLGSYRIEAKAGETESSGYFEVAEYKKPEYKVTVKASNPYIKVGDTAKFTVEAKYFFGAPVANAEVQYYIYRSRYYHWWWGGEDDDGIGASEEEEDEGDYYGYGNDMVQDGTVKLNANGQVTIDFKVPETDPKDPLDYTYRLEAQVTDSSRRVIDGKGSFTGTRGVVIATAGAERYVYYKDDTARIKVRTATYDGKPASTKVALRFVHRYFERVEKTDGNGKYDRYEYKLHEKALGAGEVTTNMQGEAIYDYKVPVTGTIRIETVLNENGREIVSYGGYLWVSDRSNAYSDYAYQDSASIKLIADKKSYKPGETAHVLAMLPVDKAHLLVTTEVNNVLTARRISAAGRTVMIDVPIEERYVPNVHLSVAYVMDNDLFSTDRMLVVPAKHKFLNLEIISNKKEYKPREAASYTVLARNADGSPAAGAEVSLGIVDEAVYSIRPESAGDIRREFYGRRFNRVHTYFSMAYNFSGYSGDKPLQISQNKPAYQLADFKNEAQYAEPMIRKEFKDTAFWQPAAVTGADGKATVNFTLPDNLTTWRATARAVTADTRVGAGLSKVLARKDLILRLETPRFATEGDTVTLSGIVHNYLDADKSAKISLEVIGAQLLNEAVQTVTIKKQGEHRIDWRMAAGQVGDVKLLAKALTDTESDAVELPLQIMPQGLRQVKGSTQTIAEENSEKTFDLSLPGNAHNVARTLRIEASPSITGTLFGALDYLTGYPYGCTEQTMSSFLPNVVVAQALRDVKGTSLRTTNNLPQKVQRGLDRLYGYQHDDGGWGWWKDDRTDPFMTAYVVDGVIQARNAGYAIESWRLNNARDALKKMIDSSKAEDGKPIDPESRAFMIYSLNASGETDARYVNDLFNSRSGLQPYGRALLALTLRARNDESRARQVAGEIESSARTNDFESYWESKRRPMLDFTEDNSIEATALSLKALAQINPKSALLPKAARWLVDHREYGAYWNSTKDTAFAIFGLLDYVKVSQELSPDYTVEVYLNNESVLTKRITSADVTSGQPLLIERKGATLANANQVRVVKRGRGTLWFASTLDYHTRLQSGEQVQPAGSNDLRLTREYLRLRVSENNGKPSWKTEPLTGEIRSGDLIVVKLRLQGNKAQRLLIEDPIPAGCEQIERDGSLAFDATNNTWTDWYSYREFRDQRTAIFVEYFDGDATYQYAMRVQIPGEFKVAPARAERMYQTNIQSNTANASLQILDKK
jgi:hypothetical protein